MDTRQKRNRPEKRSAVSESKKIRPRPDEHIAGNEQRSRVVYTPPKIFHWQHFALHMLTVVAVVIAVTLSISIFFKVKNITVSGHEKYSAWTVREASGIREGDNLLTFGRMKAPARIENALPYVKSARIGIKLPDTVMIYIEEYEVEYAVKAEDNSVWLMRSDGLLTQKATSGDEYTSVIGVTITDPQPMEQAKPLQSVRETQSVPDTQETGETGENGETEPEVTLPEKVTYTDREKLDTALKIMQYLEANDLMGQVDTINVTDLGDLELWYGSQYLVKLGNTSRLEYKIEYMKQAIGQMENYQSGELDVSFTIWTDKAGYTPFT